MAIKGELKMWRFKYLLTVCCLLNVFTANANSGFCPYGKVAIGRVTVDQIQFDQDPKLRVAPFVVWDAMRVAFSKLIYDNRKCFVQRPVVYIGDENKYDRNPPPFPLKPVTNDDAINRVLVTEFYSKYDEEGQFFIDVLLEEQIKYHRKNAMEMLVFWGPPELPKKEISEGKITLTYTIYDFNNQTETPFVVEINTPITSRKKEVENLAESIHEQITTIKGNIDQLAGE